VFKGTTFYIDEALTTVACTLDEGVYAQGGGGFSLVSGLDFSNPDQPATYEVTMGGLAGNCNNHSTTYAVARPVQRFGTSYDTLPVQTFIGP